MINIIKEYKERISNYWNNEYETCDSERGFHYYTTTRKKQFKENLRDYGIPSLIFVLPLTMGAVVQCTDLDKSASNNNDGYEETTTVVNDTVASFNENTIDFYDDSAVIENAGENNVVNFALCH